MVAAAQWIIVTLGWVGGIVMLILAFMFLQDIFQKKHSVRRNFPVIGRLRYFLERQGEFFRQYFFASDRQELPFNRATRSWIYRIAKGASDTVGFGSTFRLISAVDAGLSEGSVTTTAAATGAIVSGASMDSFSASGGISANFAPSIGAKNGTVSRENCGLG